MTVQEELENRRNCREGLRGVLVRILDAEDLGVLTIDGSGWQDRADKPAMLYMTNGFRLCATRAVLASRWPVQCCPPKVKNAFNSIEGKLFRG